MPHARTVSDTTDTPALSIQRCSAQHLLQRVEAGAHQVGSPVPSIDQAESCGEGRSDIDQVVGDLHSRFQQASRTAAVCASPFGVRSLY